MSFIIENLQEKHLPQLKKFKCDNPSMEGFLNGEAYINHVNGEGITKIVKVDGTEEIIAYYTLKCDALKITDPEMYVTPRYIPCIEIARIAVITSWQKGQKDIHLGTELMEQIITYIKDEIAVNVGCRFITLHAILDKVSWYENRLKFKKRMDEKAGTDDEKTEYMSLDILELK